MTAPPPMYTPHWITIPAGPFLMGSDPALDAIPDPNEGPRHAVEVDSFQLARTPVTNSQYAAFVRATGHPPPGHWLGGRVPDGLGEHPITYVSWHDAQAFCAWAGARLPTEAEWEKAARGVDGRLWPWGNRPPEASRGNFANRLGTTSPAGAFPAGASPWGALDMAGNVWEWTSSLAQPYPYDGGDGREEPAAAGRRIVRGGSYIHGAREIRAADRHAFVPDTPDVYIGFRVARTSPARPAAIPFEWVDVPGGPFPMGNDPRSFHDLALPDETPAHQVDLAEYAIARTPVTNGEYAAFVRAVGHQPPGHWPDGRLPAGLAGHPVVNVSWDDAAAFCSWAGVRLPAEAEWEKAARGSELERGRVYPWGNELPAEPCANFGRDPKVEGTTPVDRFPAGASPYGVLDMAGNVWEWTSSLLRDYPYRPDDGRENTASRERRVLRGGSFYSPSGAYIRCAARSSSYPQRRRDHIGLRVARL